MAAKTSVAHDWLGWLQEQLSAASPDLLRAMVASFAQGLMSAEADVLCGASYGERSQERTNSRNGYRAGVGHPRWHGGAGDSQAGSGQLLSGLAAGAAPPRGAGSD